MTIGPLERRRRTAQLVYSTDGPGALLKLVPTVARNERERLRRSLRLAKR